jgi:hypothetical protein
MRKLFSLLIALVLAVGSTASSFAFWQSRDSNYNIAISTLPGPPTLTYVGNASGTASHSGAVETFTNASIGTAAGFTTRRIIFVLTSNSLVGPTSISSILINGSIFATVHVQQSQVVHLRRSFPLTFQQELQQRSR